jgi:eukaryotic-like serine/threonine-protein kinase
MIVGSAQYLSPEQVRGEDVGPPSDVYTLGLVLLECLIGAPVFRGAGIEPVVARLHRDPQVPDDLEPALGQLLIAMTSRDPAQRPTAQHAAAGLGDDSITPPLPLAPLVAVSDRDETTAPPPGIGTVQIDRGESGHRWAWITAACVAILVALAWSVVVLGNTPVDQTGTDGSSATAPPEATDPAPTSPATTSTPSEPAVGPAGGPGDRPEADTGNDKNKGKGKDKGGGGKKPGD